MATADTERMVAEEELLAELGRAMYHDRARAEGLCQMLFGDGRIGTSPLACKVAVVMRELEIRYPRTKPETPVLDFWCPGYSPPCLLIPQGPARAFRV